MKIDEAIAHAREVARINRKQYKNCPADRRDSEHQTCEQCAEEHEQLAAWLEELKDYRDKNKMVVRVDVENMDSVKDKIEELSKYAESQYNKAIDDFAEKIKENISESLIWGMIADCFKYKNMNDTSGKIVDYVIDTVKETAEQLKAGD